MEKQTSDAYSEHIRHFTSWMRSERRELDADAIVTYFTGLRLSGFAANTVIVRRQAVKKRLRQMFRLGGMGTQIAANLEQFLSDLDREPETKAPKVASRSVPSSKFLRETEYQSCLEACNTERQRLFFTLLWETGLRVSELCGIRIEDARGEEDIIFVRIRGKGAKERIVRLRRSLWRRTRAMFGGQRFLLETSRGNRYQRDYVTNQIATISERALGKAFRAHALRHSFATRMIERTRKIQAVSEYLGHAGPAITLAMYTHEDLDDGELFDR